jgi:malonyl-CoA/methylmalonyl-CoA synthetase
MPLLSRILAWDGPALFGAEEVSYHELAARAAAVAADLAAPGPDRNSRVPSLRSGPAGAFAPGTPVAIFAPPSAAYVELLLGVMLAGGLAVPLSPLHTGPELRQILDDARPATVLTTAELASRIEALGLPWRAYRPAAAPLPAPLRDDRGPAPALMLYTSGTTGRPKGVVLSHQAVAATCAALDQAWGWRRDDRLLHVLPLHHTHGVIVALLGALWAGASLRFAAFEAARVWGLLGEATVFMAVPTIYTRLLEAFRAAPPEVRAAWSDGARRVRLFTSGSAALPATVLEEFRQATGQTLLERYGMTEIGMALSNPLDGARVPGAVGRPLPGVTVDIVAEDGAPAPDGEPGELRVRSPQLFSGYRGDPASTAAAYDGSGRFRTGDTGVREPGTGIVRLLGRTSTDVLKSGGYKLSALEIEEALRAHPAIAEVAVVGLPDDVWGDRVTACVVLRPGHEGGLTLDELRAWARDRLAPYKLPRELRILAELPRNAMGKVQKTVLKQKHTPPR